MFIPCGHSCECLTADNIAMSVANVSHSASMTKEMECLVCAVKKSFWFLPCLNNTIVHGEVVFDAAPIRISEEKTVR